MHPGACSSTSSATQSPGRIVPGEHGQPPVARSRPGRRRLGTGSTPTRASRTRSSDFACGSSRAAGSPAPAIANRCLCGCGLRRPMCLVTARVRSAWRRIDAEVAVHRPQPPRHDYRCRHLGRGPAAAGPVPPDLGADRAAALPARAVQLKAYPNLRTRMTCCVNLERPACAAEGRASRIALTVDLALGRQQCRCPSSRAEPARGRPEGLLRKLAQGGQELANPPEDLTVVLAEPLGLVAAVDEARERLRDRGSGGRA